MARYLVTGGAGFIGSHIAEVLVHRGDHQVRILDNFSAGKRTNIQHLVSLEVIEGDIRNIDTVHEAMHDVDYVIHQAAMVSVSQSMIDPMTTHEVNVNGTLNILLAAREFNVKRVVLASSCAVYGDNDDLPSKEDSTTKPLSPYAASKLSAEVYCQSFHRAYGTPIVCLRYFNIFGPRQDPNGEYAAVIPKFAQRMMTKRAPIIYGDGQQTRDFVHVGDVVRANLLACERAEAIGQTYNVASGCSVSLLELVTALNHALDTHFTPEFQPARSGDIRHSAGDNRRITTQLGFALEKPFTDRLAETTQTMTQTAVY
jgi:nucleoside-diphosphate-sugar epimerase